jgi:hypothetical protein
MRIKSLFIIIYSFKVQNMHSLQTERLMSLHVWLCLEGTPVTQKRGPGLLINRTILCIFILLSYLEVSSSFFSATQIQTHRHTHTHMHVCIYLCTHVHTYAHIITFTHTHTHTHTSKIQNGKGIHRTVRSRPWARLVRREPLLHSHSRVKNDHSSAHSHTQPNDQQCLLNPDMLA